MLHCSERFGFGYKKNKIRNISASLVAVHRIVIIFTLLYIYKLFNSFKYHCFLVYYKFLQNFLETITSCLFSFKGYSKLSCFIFFFFFFFFFFVCHRTFRILTKTSK